MKEIDMRTEKEKKVQEVHRKVCDMYKRVREESPEFAPHRVMRKIAEQFGYTTNNVRVILVQNNLYQPRVIK